MARCFFLSYGDSRVCSINAVTTRWDLNEGFVRWSLTSFFVFRYSIECNRSVLGDDCVERLALFRNGLILTSVVNGNQNKESRMSDIGFDISPNVRVGDGVPLLIMAGPCVIESEEVCMRVARTMKDFCKKLGLGYVFKASFDKANRTSVDNFRGPGLDKGLRILQRVKEELQVPIVTDVHAVDQVSAVAEVVDVIQIPAFLCRQTDLLVAAGNTRCVVNVKKGQFLAPEQMAHAIGKVRSTGAERIMVTERGTTFGYGNLVVDMRSLSIMRGLGVPVVFDATHSVQLPGGQGGCSGGKREFAPVLIRAALGVGVDGIFMEVHPNPDVALCDGLNSLSLSDVEPILTQGKAIDEITRSV